LAKRLQYLRLKEVIRCPGARQLTRRQTSGSDRAGARCQYPTSIDAREKISKWQDYSELR